MILLDFIRTRYSDSVIVDFVVGLTSFSRASLFFTQVYKATTERSHRIAGAVEF